jgi:hypothetical protein
LREDIANALCGPECFVGSTRSERVWSNDHGDRLAVAGESHLFPSKHAGEDLGKGGSRFTYGHRQGHDRDCTEMYVYVQSSSRGERRVEGADSTARRTPAFLRQVDGARVGSKVSVLRG